MRFLRPLLLGFLVLLVSATAFFYSKSPSHERDWAPDQARLPNAEVAGDIATISNIRDFRYRTAEDFDATYETRSYDLSKIARTWYVVVPFGAPGVAHAFLSFEFDDGAYVSVSVEARREAGESYSPIKGAFHAYELMYVVGDERDVIGVRANQRKHDVYLYPLALSREQSRTVFESMLRDINAIAEQPEFYNTFTGSCMTGVAKHLAAAGVRIPLSLEFLLPAYSDKLFYDLGLIKGELAFDALKAASLINERASALEIDADFSRAIRDQK